MRRRPLPAVKVVRGPFILTLHIALQRFVHVVYIHAECIQLEMQFGKLGMTVSTSEATLTAVASWVCRCYSVRHRGAAYGAWPCPLTSHDNSFETVTHLGLIGAVLFCFRLPTDLKPVGCSVLELVMLVPLL